MAIYTPTECPNCMSPDIEEKGYLGSKWKCNDCGHTWDPKSEYEERRYYEDDDDDDDGYLF